jgi:peptide/nickel transport system substrate-binding protein
MLGRAMLVLSIALLAFGSCSPGGSAGRDGRAHWLRIATGLGDPNSLNIHLDPSGTTGDVAELTQAYFVRYDRRAKPVPELITEIPTQANRGISPDGKTITWHLRRGVTWSDGVPFTGDDVVFTVNAINNPANNEEQGTAGWEEIASMDQPDAYTVRFHLKRPYGSYLPLYFGTAANEPCILPKHLLGSLPNINTAAYNAKPVGIGPFRITAWRRGDAIEMEANPNYWRGKPKLAGITFKLLPSQETLVTQMQTGEVDLWPLLPPSYAERLRGVASLTVRTEPNYRTTNLDFVYARTA